MNWACIAPQTSVLAACPAPAGWFSPDEQARCARFTAERRQREFAAGRWLARLLLARAGAGEPAILRLTQDGAGRCLAPEPWRLSISHSGAWVGVVVSDDVPVGLDLQVESPTRDWSAMATFAGLLPCPDAAYFYRHWTLAEAWLKSHADIGSLSALRGLRWQADPAGPALQGRLDQLHWAFVGASTPVWVSELLPGALQPDAGQRWSPLSAA
ncbi:4'-phosphopantetheinyl transferase superfamily protein [Paucibacter sp. JuS9]|uniref:4'-phosphopantetheinyl transferase family protein n=1 Tax=Paucibacter sp. JuS9 TaxID=3228748 RepID=UPI0037567D10